MIYLLTCAFLQKAPVGEKKNKRASDAGHKLIKYK